MHVTCAVGSLSGATNAQRQMSGSISLYMLSRVCLPFACSPSALVQQEEYTMCLVTMNLIHRKYHPKLIVTFRELDKIGLSTSSPVVSFMFKK